MQRQADSPTWPGRFPRRSQKLGVEVRVILPKYKGIEEKGLPITYPGMRISVPVSQRMVEGEIAESRYNGVTVYLVEKDEYYYRDDLYSTQDGDFIDNAERFVFFSRAILEAIKATGFVPDVIHCNDWQTALVPVFLHTAYRQEPLLARIATLLTIHNLGYQGLFWHLDWHLLNMGWEYFTPNFLEFYGKINFLKGGIVFSDIINTVSKRYSEEIQTPEFGSGLEGILRTRKEVLYGIVNGIDYDEWSPETDTHIPAHYSAEDLAGKAVCKAALQKAFGLPVDHGQAGHLQHLPSRRPEGVRPRFRRARTDALLRRPVYPARNGRAQVPRALLRACAKIPSIFLPEDRLRQRPRPSYRSRLRYVSHALPLRAVRAQPALQPEVRHGPHRARRGRARRHDKGRARDPESRTGFKFDDYTVDAMLGAVERALAVYRNPEDWKLMVGRCMKQNFSWEKSAEEYKALYEKAIKHHEFR